MSSPAVVHHMLHYGVLKHVPMHVQHYYPDIQAPGPHAKDTPHSFDTREGGSVAVELSDSQGHVLMKDILV